MEVPIAVIGFFAQIISIGIVLLQGIPCQPPITVIGTMLDHISVLVVFGLGMTHESAVCAVSAISDFSPVRVICRGVVARQTTIQLVVFHPETSVCGIIVVAAIAGDVSVPVIVGLRFLRAAISMGGVF